MKNRLVVTLLSLCSMMCVASQSIQHHVVKVDDFTELVVLGAVNVDYRSSVDSAGIAVFDARADIVNVFMFSNNGKGKLTVRLDTDGARLTKLPTLRVYSRELASIENRADSTVRAFNINATAKFKAKLEGNGRLSVRNISADEVQARMFTGRGQLAIDGTCRKASLSCTGVGAIQADQLKSSEAAVSVNGPCNIGCYVTEELTVKGVGPGSVYYAGAPDVIKNHSINVKLQNIGEDK